MCRMEMVQQQIDITRNQIINQLQDEIVQFQQKISQVNGETRGVKVYQTIIYRKQTLIRQLSQIQSQ